MYQFCFNDCIPNTASEHSLTQCLVETLKEYNEVKKEYPEDVDGIVTSVSINDFILNAQLNYNLATCVSAMPDKDLRTLAYRIFTKHPIENYYAEIDEEDLLRKDYTITIAGTNHTAINPVIVSVNNGVLFTLGLHQDLRKDVLQASSKANATVDINNLFGHAVNTTFIKALIKQSLTDKLENFEKLLAIIGTNSYSPRFKKSFDGLSSQVQQSILEHFEAAKNRNGITPFFSDNDLVKDVSPIGIAFRVFELRVFKPVPFRVYFYERQTRTYLAMVEKKPAEKKQDNHIDAATSIISQMILMEN
jgi:hypothetical protein